MHGPQIPNADEPLSEATFLILVSLSSDPRHGYAIMKDVRSLSDGRIVLSTGTLYGALKRLLEQGWIRRVEETGESTWPASPGRPRKAYQLTPAGRRAMGSELARLKRLVSVARPKVAGEGA